MKKIIVFLLTAVLCLSTLAIMGTATEIPTHTGTHTGTHAEIFPIEKYTPIVDGTRDPQYLFSREVTIRDNGPQYAKGSIYYLWDDTALYFYVYIMDATPGDAENGVNHESDCIEMNFSLYNFDYNADNITAKQASDIGDAQFRVFRDKVISNCENLVDNGIVYGDGSHGGFGKWVFDNTADKTTFKYTEGDASYIIHNSDATGYWFEGFVKWSPELLNDAEHPLGEGSVIGLGTQVNDDINKDNKRDLKCYADNSAPNDWSMSGNRATGGKFCLVNNNYAQGAEPEDAESSVPTPPSAGEAPDAGDDTPETADPSVIFALATVISAGGFTVFAAKKSKKD